MYLLKPATVIFAFAFMSIASAKLITTAAGIRPNMPAGETERELVALARSAPPVIIEDHTLPGALAGDHIETRKLILTSVTEEADAPKIPMATATSRPVVFMNKPRLVADATPPPAAPASQPAAASITNKGSTPQSFAVDSGATEKVYTVAPSATVTIENCAEGCTVTGPWGYSRKIKAGEAIVTTGASDVTATKAVKAAAVKTASMKTAVSAQAKSKKKAELTAPHAKKKSATAAKSKPEPSKSKPAKAKSAKAKSADYNPYFKGSFMSLFTGIVR